MHRLLRISFGMVFLLVSVLAAGTALGQGGATGAISGEVLDTQGGSVADADVQIVSVATDSVVRKVTTSVDGSFAATLLPPGTYYVVVNKSGFSEAKASNIEVRVTETTKIAITLKAGAVSEKVEISATVTTVETTNATTGQSINSPLATHANNPCAAFSPDGRLIVSARLQACAAWPSSCDTAP